MQLEQLSSHSVNEVAKFAQTVRNSFVALPELESPVTHIAGFERDQLLLLPEAMDDYVGSDNPVRFIDAFVSGLISRLRASCASRPRPRAGLGARQAVF